VIGIDPAVRLRLKATAEVVTIGTPPFRCGTIVGPFALLEWAARGLKVESKAGIEWLLEGEPTWPEGRVVAFSAPKAMQYANMPLYRHPGHAGVLTRYRVRLDHAAGAEIDLKSIITAGDPRHATPLAAAHAAYDAEIAAMKASVFQSHGYEPYPVLFDRTIAWADKEPPLMGMKKSGDNAEENSKTDIKKNRQKKKAKQ
jgi:hypothetical protein